MSKLCGWNDKENNPVMVGDSVVDKNGIKYTMKSTEVIGFLIDRNVTYFYLLSMDGLRNLSSDYVKQMIKV